MNLLAFDCSTETLSIAVQRGVPGTAQAWTYEGAGGAQASAQLITRVQTLLQQAGLRLTDLQAIAYGAGPGAFTGLRTACSVAQGLGFGANVPLLPIDTLLAVAEDARLERDPWQVLAALDARMDEVYAGLYRYQDGQWQTQREPQLLRPGQVSAPAGCDLAGNIGPVYGTALPPNAQGQQPCVQAALPRAPAMLRLAPALLAQGLAVPASQALPRYVRDKVAQTSAERAAERAVPPP